MQRVSIKQIELKPSFYWSGEEFVFVATIFMQINSPTPVVC